MADPALWVDTTHMMIPLNADGDGPETDPAKVTGKGCICGCPNTRSSPEPPAEVDPIQFTVHCMVGGADGTVHLVGPPEAVAAIEAALAAHDEGQTS
jgi:hypothetical protein